KEDLGLRLFLQNMLGGVDTGGGGLHLTVHENEVKVGLRGQGLDLLAAGGTAHHGDILLLIEDVDPILPDHVNVRGARYADHAVSFPAPDGRYHSGAAG